MLPRLYLGTMTFGWSQASSKVDVAVATAFVNKFASFSPEVKAHLHVDTARIYAGGETEPIVAKALAGATQATTDGNLLLGSKAHPSQPGGLSAEGLEKQFAASCAALEVSSLAEFYLHQPDTEHSLLESLKCTDALVKSGKIGAVGLSNYHASEVARAFELCKEHGLTPPSVYQGLYNPLNRLVEEELIPLLHANDCAFVAYNPLAAGLLTGKHTSPDQVAAGRFKENPNYLPRFYTTDNFAALASIRSACDAAGVSLVDAAYRWLLCHSALDGSQRDGVLLGASSLEQLDANLAACASARQAGPLPKPVVDAMDGVWSGIPALREGAFPYWRSFSSDMPDELVQKHGHGASYEAHGPK